MIIAKTIEETRAHVREARARGKRIGFVPTMGYLHRGHTSLVEESRRRADFQVMSIFVNRIQFNDPKDYQTYPREFERDFAIAREAGVDLVFLPDDEIMYRDQLTHIDVDLVTEQLCGAYRPGHFRGVFTVVTKLFNIVQPDVSVFGQKDIQQAVSIEKMVFDLNLPVEIVIAPTVREDDGLAMSSRNKHLDAAQRNDALAISRSLRRAQELIAAGERNAAVILGAMRGVVDTGNPQKIDYISMVRYSDLQPIDTLTGKSVIAVAAYFGPTRLIDNMVVNRESGGFSCVY
ncbi:MAG: pantoate--beta-alanine ligase [Spirochaetes bacterium]|nr:MAG: pantoate--beta-alanine ligase [Spirochaetota bacterium]